jgi:hypothetical protein
MMHQIIMHMSGASTVRVPPANSLQKSHHPVELFEVGLMLFLSGKVRVINHPSRGCTCAGDI